MRLIDADAVMRMLTSIELNNGTITDAKMELRNVKTAYDVDAVVKELEDSVVCGMFGARLGKSDAEIIDIIRKGGA